MLGELGEILLIVMGVLLLVLLPFIAVRLFGGRD
jgi:hypothetical protein